MKKTVYDRIQTVALAFLKPFVYPWMWFDTKRTVFMHDVNPKRKEPYLMLANHTFMFDVIHVPLLFHRVPFIVASESLFVKQPTKFLFKWIAHVIPKSKGASDLRTAKGIISTIRKGYPVLIFPEGDTTYFGETRNVEFSTMKLIKKLKVDVITCTVKGGYLSKPRWATGKRKKRAAEFHYHLTIKKDELVTMTIDEINERVNKALYNNDYEYQRKAMIKHPGKNLAEGLENVLYVCPECEAINSLKTKGNTITCTSCKTEGRYNEYGFIEGFTYDNLIDWDNYQKTCKERLRKAHIDSSGRLHYIRYDDSTKEYIGDVRLHICHGVMKLTGAVNKDIPIHEVSNPKLTLRRNLNFIHDGTFYFIPLDKYASSVLRILQDKY